MVKIVFWKTLWYSNINILPVAKGGKKITYRSLMCGMSHATLTALPHKVEIIYWMLRIDYARLSSLQYGLDVELTAFIRNVRSSIQNMSEGPWPIFLILNNLTTCDHTRLHASVFLTQYMQSTPEQKNLFMEI